jgi:hypothetical protein
MVVNWSPFLASSVQEVIAMTPINASMVIKINFFILIVVLRVNISGVTVLINATG